MIFLKFQIGTKFENLNINIVLAIAASMKVTLDIFFTSSFQLFKSFKVV